MDVVIHHNPACGTSRNALDPIRDAEVEPHVVEDPKAPPSRTMLTNLIARMGLAVRAVQREKGTPHAKLGLGDPALADDRLLAAMPAHPILIDRPIAVTPKGVGLCRPSEAVIDLLPPQAGAFAEESGGPAAVTDAQGRHRGAAP